MGNRTSTNGASAFHSSSPLLSIDNETTNIRFHNLNEFETCPYETKLVCVCGKMRGGKSFLLNFLTGNDEAFVTRPGMESVTKGADMYFPAKLRSYQRDTARTPYRVCWVDVEGIGGTEEGYDRRLTAPLVFVSSVLIYNHTGTLTPAGEFFFRSEGFM
jgi:hypothetical protein